MNNDPLIGVTISDQYLLTERLGAGGMGCVYRAENLKLSGRPCAIKVLLDDVGDSKSGKKRFEEELKIISQLRSPHIVQVTDKGELDDGRLFIVMELLEGEPLSAMIQREGALPLKRAIPILQGVLAGLSEAHQQGVIHRDLKPANIFITRSVVGYEIAKVLDFGIAKSTDPNAVVLTQSQQIMGTPRYMTPEQFMQEPLTLRTDLYAAGLLFYEMLAGSPPFTKRSEVVPREVRSLPEVVQLMWLHLNAEPPKLEHVPLPVWELCLQLLSKRQEDRPSEATQVIELLNRLKELPEAVMGDAPSPSQGQRSPSGSLSAPSLPQLQAPSLMDQQRLDEETILEQSPSGDLARVSGAVEQLIRASSPSEDTVLTSQELSGPFGREDYTIQLTPQRSSLLRPAVIIGVMTPLLGLGIWSLMRPSTPDQPPQQISLPSPVSPPSPRVQPKPLTAAQPLELMGTLGEQAQVPIEIPAPRDFELESDQGQSADDVQDERALKTQDGDEVEAQVKAQPRAKLKSKSASSARVKSGGRQNPRSKAKRKRSKMLTKRSQRRSQRRPKSSSRSTSRPRANAAVSSIQLSLMSRGMFFTPGARLRLKTVVKPSERLRDVVYKVYPKGAAQVSRGSVQLASSLSTSIVRVTACVEAVCSLPIKIRIGLEDAPE